MAGTTIYENYKKPNDSDRLSRLVQKINIKFCPLFQMMIKMLVSNSKLWVVGELVLAQCSMIVHKVDKVEFNDKTILQHLKYASLFTPENGSMIQSTLQCNLNNATF